MNKKFVGLGDYPNAGAKSPEPGTPVVHVAGEFKDGVQRCSRCGLMLSSGKKALAAPGTSITTEGSKMFVGVVQPGASDCRSL